MFEPYSTLRGLAIPQIRRALALIASTALVTAGLIVAPLALAPTTAHAAVGPECAELNQGETCTFTYEKYPHNAFLNIGTDVSVITVLATGGASAHGEGPSPGRGAAGPGSLVIAVMPITDHSRRSRSRIPSSAIP